MLRYVAGNKLQHALSYSNKLIQQNKQPIINYIAENTNTNTNTNNLEREINIYHEYINLLNNIDKKFMVALKLSSFSFDKTLINKLIYQYRNKHIQLVIDAEDNKNIDNYRKIINELMLDKDNNSERVYSNYTNPSKKCKYNYVYPGDNFLISKTYQMYRKDSLDELRDDFKMMENKNKIFIPKIVRGAYWNSEYKDGHLFTSKEDTNINYLNAMIECSRHKNGHNILATHNNDSITLALTMNLQRPIFSVYHLMGMNEDLMKSYEGRIKLGTYVPYGPYREMIPYLTRRLYENIDSVKYMFT